MLIVDIPFGVRLLPSAIQGRGLKVRQIAEGWV